MNRKKGLPSLLVVAFLGMVLSLPACATMSKKTGVQRAESATISMQKVETDMKQASAQIDATNAALRDVLVTGQTAASQPADVKKSFDAYSNNVKKMNQIAKTMNASFDQMNTRGNTYFQEWSKEGGTYTNPQIQKLSQQERARLTGTFNNITASSAGVRGSLNSYVSQIKQIESYLSNNLSAQGITVIASIAQSATAEGENLKQSFMPVQTAIDQARVQMTPGGAAAGGGPAASQPDTMQQNRLNQQLDQPQLLQQPRPQKQLTL